MTRKLFGNPVLRKYREYGLFGGFVLGTLVGILSSGPHFHEWSVGQSLAVVCASAVGIALLGCLGLPMVMGAMASQVPVGEEDADAESASSDNHAPVRGEGDHAGN
ncbi:MAG: hypothetical protein V4772_10960 [Pseudomonadota bacterium]